MGGAVEVTAEQLTEILHTLEVLTDAVEHQEQVIAEQNKVIKGLANDLDSLAASQTWPNDSSSLATWVNTWLIPTFELQSPLAGWADRPGAVSELSALHLGYLGMGNKPGFAPLRWHAEIPAVVERIKNLRSRETKRRHGGTVLDWAAS